MKLISVLLSYSRRTVVLALIGGIISGACNAAAAGPHPCGPHRRPRRSGKTLVILAAPLRQLEEIGPHRLLASL